MTFWRRENRLLASAGNLASLRSERHVVKTILFVCTANICRSPTAKAIFDVLSKDKGISVRADSAGTAALIGEALAPNSVRALNEVGIYPGEHRARQVSREMIEGSDLVLTMTAQHAVALRKLSAVPEKVYTLPEYVTGDPSAEGIPDPYGQTMIAYRSSVRQLHEYLGRALVVLKGG